MAPGRYRKRVTLVGGERSPHCAIPASQIPSYSIILSFGAENNPKLLLVDR